MENIYNCVQFVFVPAFGQHFKEQSVQLCMNMFASCLHLVCGFHELVLFSQSIKLTVQLCITIILLKVSRNKHHPSEAKHKQVHQQRIQSVI
jgi:hypothetical protein